MQFVLPPAAVAAFSTEADIAKRLAPLVMAANEAAACVPQPSAETLARMAPANLELAAVRCPLWRAFAMR